MSEKRFYKTFNPEIRKVETDDDKMHIEGKAVAFYSPETYYGETEVIDRHALDSADMTDVVLRYNHNDTQYTLARTRNHSLNLEIRDDGLYFDADLIPTTTNKDAYLMVKEGLLDKCSFAFTIDEDKYDNKQHLRTITKIGRLYDVALVDFPFYNDTMVEARSLDTRDDFIKRVKEEQRKALLLELKKKELLKRLK
jgi:HK97 family phage prohead protease